MSGSDAAGFTPQTVNVITLFPGMFAAVSGYGICHQAIKKGLLDLKLTSPRTFATDAHRTVDDRPYGGGPGMVMMPGPLSRCIDSVVADSDTPVYYLSPQGERLTQKVMQSLSELDSLVLLCGRYEGVDERVIESRVDAEISVGDFVLAGGEYAAMMLIEGMIRLRPGVLGNEESAQQDSFSNGLLDCPHYTRPAVFEGMRVPEVLTGGNHRSIAEWREMQSRLRTRQRRPDLLDDEDSSPKN
ncbi:MAG: tRNA (guanosine(37)-N1)-methyltransferase TrmD [Pseudomonadota bacterium]